MLWTEQPRIQTTRQNFLIFPGANPGAQSSLARYSSELDENAIELGRRKPMHVIPGHTFQGKTVVPFRMRMYCGKIRVNKCRSFAGFQQFSPLPMQSNPIGPGVC